MTELLKKQLQFSRAVSKFLPWLLENGYEFKFGEAKRSNEQAIINAMGPEGRNRLRMFLRQNPAFFELESAIADNTGSGIRNSLHEKSLAIDLLLFKDGEYLRMTDDYQEAGERWEKIGEESDGIPLIWGGRFGDGNHFSLAYQGKK